MNHEINQLIHFALDHHLITEDEIDYSVNLLLDLLGEENFVYEEIDEHFSEASVILESILDQAVAKGLIENTPTQRDLFDTRLMNCLMPRPHTVIQTFKENYQISPQTATDAFYQLSMASNYIRKSRTDKNLLWKKHGNYGEIVITINLSKPEKDPKEIAKAKLMKASGYPKCPLCKENVGFKGDLNRPACQNHRIIPLDLDGNPYYLQYSPYVYYNEHCIIFNKEHQPMIINEHTFRHLFAFLKQFPHYMIGSNADLAIVGGSILNHDHYQGGRAEFPIQKATIIRQFSAKYYPHTLIEIVNWPLSTIRLTSHHEEELIALSNRILTTWREYDDPEFEIFSHTVMMPHNTITPIARRVGNCYQIDLVLRNNRTSEQYPDGIFHPHPESHHIKKENIGLIEVMGLAILPARLKDELQALKACLLGQAAFEDHPELEKHRAWAEELMTVHTFTEENAEQILQEGVADKFVSVLEDCGVYKLNEAGIAGFIRFLEKAVEE